MLRWWQKLLAARSAQRQAIAADAEVLRVMFGGQSYYEARRRSRDCAPPESDHWCAVAVAIAKMTGRKIGLDTATRMAGPDE
jgi:hypothetical protein